MGGGPVYCLQGQGTRYGRVKLYPPHSASPRRGRVSDNRQYGPDE